MRLRALSLAFVTFCLAAQGQTPLPEGYKVEDHYTKEELTIEMRDGTRLFTIVYTPKDASKDRRYPILMQRTCYSVAPYNDGGEVKYRSRLGPSQYLMQDGYIFVYQDVRGRWMSEGQFVNMTPHVPHTPKTQATSESSDTWDTIEFLLGHLKDKTNGRVGQWGISYPGFYSAASLPDAHPALVAVSPQAPIADFFFDDFHHNGAYTLGYFWTNRLFGTPRSGPTPKPWYTDDPDPALPPYEYFLAMGSLKHANRVVPDDNFMWREIVDHPNYDTLWQRRGLLQHLGRLQHRPAVLTVGGWFDAEDLFGPLNIYQTLEKGNAGMSNRIVMGPWSHGNWARETEHQLVDGFYFGSNLSEHYQRTVEYPFFRSLLKDGQEPPVAEATVYNTGKLGWASYPAWPPAESQPLTLYLGDTPGQATGAVGELGLGTPLAGAAASEFVSDPNRPVPYSEANAHVFTPRPYMASDQRENSHRPDVLSFDSGFLTEELTLAGPLEVELYVSTTGTDADWVVKLVDVFPSDTTNPELMAKGKQLAGYQLLVRSEIMPARFRNSFERPEAMVPGQVTKVTFRLQDVYHTFLPGHRLQIQVQSTWYPLFDRNPQVFVENPYMADPSQYTRQTHRVHHSNEHPSQVRVRVLPRP